jgi:hypothetical protein
MQRRTQKRPAALTQVYADLSSERMEIAAHVTELGAPGIDIAVYMVLAHRQNDFIDDIA